MSPSVFDMTKSWLYDSINNYFIEKLRDSS